MATATISLEVDADAALQDDDIGGKSEASRRERLFARVDELLAEVGEPRSLAEVGVAREEFEAALPDLAKAAFSDASIRTNPRIPLLVEIVGLLQAGYGS